MLTPVVRPIPFSKANQRRRNPSAGFLPGYMGDPVGHCEEERLLSLRFGLHNSTEIELLQRLFNREGRVVRGGAISVKSRKENPANCLRALCRDCAQCLLL